MSRTAPAVLGQKGHFSGLSLPSLLLFVCEFGVWRRLRGDLGWEIGLGMKELVAVVGDKANSLEPGVYFVLEDMLPHSEVS
jgi:hypothetical protein